MAVTQFFFSNKSNAAQFLQQELISLGGEVELADLGIQHGANIPLPPVLLGILGKDPAKKTVSHYLISLHCWTVNLNLEVWVWYFSIGEFYLDKDLITAPVVFYLQFLILI